MPAPENQWYNEVQMFIDNPPPAGRGFSAWGLAWRICLAVLILYVLLTAALILS